MGTSKGHKMPTGGDWGPLKREATDFAQNIGTKPRPPQPLLRRYLRVVSNAGAPSGAGKAGQPGHGAGSGGGGGRTRNFGAGVSTGQAIGRFFSRIGQVGLSEALREIGLGGLVGKAAAEVSVALLDKLAGPGSTLDQAAARQALVELNEEVLAGAETYEDVEQVLAKALDKRGLLEILLRFFGHYIYACFCRDFYERLLKKVGSSQAAQSLKSIRDCIEAAVRAKLTGKSTKDVDWQGTEGKRLSEQVLTELIEIFDVPS